MNIIYIHTHDTGKMISPYGFNLPTPNLEKFAQEAITYSNYFSASPTCTPSRGAVMTGTYPSKNGLIGLCQRGFSLNDPSWHIANVLQNLGYETAISGIQHEACRYEDVNIEELNKIGYKHILTKQLQGDFEKWDMDNLQSTLDFLDEYNDERPFFISHGLFTTHRPFYDSIDYTKPTYYVPFRAATNEINEEEMKFQNSVKVMDNIMGDILNSLDKNNFTEDTLIIISTDHGVPFTMQKGTLNDEGTNIMLMIRHPKLTNEHGKMCNSLLSNIDLLPTILELIDAEIPSHVDGISFKDTLTNVQHETRDHIFSEMNFHTAYEPAISIRTKRFRLTKYLKTDYKQINWSNNDPCVGKDYLHDNLKNYVKSQEFFVDYLLEHFSNIITEDNSLEYEKLNKQLLDWQNNRPLHYKFGDDFLDTWGVNKDTDYIDFLEGFPGWDELYF